MKTIDNVDKIENVRGGNSYLIKTDDGLAVIDTGLPGNAENIANYVKESGHRLEEVKYIILTHADIDHTGSVAQLKKLTDASVAIHIDDFPVSPDIFLNDGDTIAGFRVIHTPGHTPGSIALYRGDGTMFSGDTLLSDEKGRVKPPANNMSLDYNQALASAEKIKSLHYKNLLTGHGQPVLDK